MSAEQNRFYSEGFPDSSDDKKMIYLLFKKMEPRPIKKTPVLIPRL